MRLFISCLSPCCHGSVSIISLRIQCGLCDCGLERRRLDWRSEVESSLSVSTDRLRKSVVSVSDSVSPTDRPAARSAAKQISGRDARPTDPPGRRRRRPSRLGPPDRPTQVEPPALGGAARGGHHHLANLSSLTDGRLWLGGPSHSRPASTTSPSSCFLCSHGPVAPPARGNARGRRLLQLVVRH